MTPPPMVRRKCERGADVAPESPEILAAAKGHRTTLHAFGDDRVSGLYVKSSSDTAAPDHRRTYESILGANRGAVDRPR